MNTLAKKNHSTIDPCIGGLIVLQLFSILLIKEKANLKNCEVNFLLTLFSFFTLDEKKAQIWEKHEVNGPLSLKEFISLFEQKFDNSAIHMIKCKRMIIFEDYTNNFDKDQ